ncbi:PREDICTED: auxin-induced protein 15A [Tarenaya hassleriana]|uniref:auxin-induced protein 15A n=1 Tax=Tarenaya hassleriana TaxID=28532 RepID=UPI00053C0C6A|nr:PREDICTED: auxin-induced protein 15A [Tarenaya hassleriana]
MLSKKMASFKNLAKRVKNINTTTRDGETESHNESLLGKLEADDTCQRSYGSKSPTGTFAVYVGEERERFVVPTSYLTHPLFKILLDKSHDELCCFDQKVRLVVPCNASIFQEVVNAVECCNGKFDFGHFVEEFI